MASQKIITPLGELRWVFITGEGRESLNGDPRYSAALRLKTDSKELAQIEAEIKAFWEAEKPKEAKKCASNGIRLEQDKDGKETGYSLVNFWTGTHFADGKQKVVNTYNSRGQKVSLGAKSIGNGSVGAISGTMSTYSSKPNHGVTLYLSGIQLTKFVEYSQDDGFEAQEGDFEQVEEDEFNNPTDEAPDADSEMPEHQSPAAAKAAKKAAKKAKKAKKNKAL